MVFLRGMIGAFTLSLLYHLAGAQKIPDVHGTSFTGATVDLPDALRGKAGVLVIGFSQGSRDAVTVWGKKLAVDYYDSPAVAYYEMPVLAGVPKLMRGFVAGRIKAAVSDRGRPHFVPLVENEAAWRSLVHYTAPDDAYVLVVDGFGVVRWQTQGQATDAAYAVLKQKLEALELRDTTASGR
jgi:hypothetical protein